MHYRLIPDTVAVKLSLLFLSDVCLPVRCVLNLCSSTHPVLAMILFMAYE